MRWYNCCKHGDPLPSFSFSRRLPWAGSGFACGLRQVSAVADVCQDAQGWSAQVVDWLAEEFGGDFPNRTGLAPRYPKCETDCIGGANQALFRLFNLAGHFTVIRWTGFYAYLPFFALIPIVGTFWAWSRHWNCRTAGSAQASSGMRCGTISKRSAMLICGDVDVIWYDPRRADAIHDREFEALLRVSEPSTIWSVKNQARMHVRNGDAPYSSATHAMRFWPETATAIAARRTHAGDCEIAAPFGLHDMFNLVLRPTPRFQEDKRSIYEERIQSKSWRDAWPLLTRIEI